MKFFVFIFILFLSKSLAQRNCIEKENTAENLVKLVFRTESEDQKLIQTDEDFEQFCIDGKNGLKNVKDYNNCLSGVAKQVISIVYSNAVKAVKKFCTTDVENAKKFLFCFDEERTKGIQQCMFRFSEAASYSVNTKIDSEVIPSVCCGYIELHECIDKIHKVPCETSETFDDHKYGKEFRQSVFGSAVDLMCSSFKSDTCRSKQNSLMKKVKSYAKRNPVNIDNFSLVNKLKLISEKLAI